MKKLMVLAAMCYAAVVMGDVTFSTSAGLKMTIDDKGRIAKMSGCGENILHSVDESSLVNIRLYEKDGELFKVGAKVLKPESMKIIEAKGDKVLRLGFEGGNALDIKVSEKGEYLRMEILRTDSSAGIADVSWGPYTTSLHDTVGKFLGVVRSKDFAFGVMALDARTDGINVGGYGETAFHREGKISGGIVTLHTVDHTRAVRYNYKQFVSVPTDDAKLEGAAVAFWGVGKPTKARELDVIEKIVRGEGLPCPTIDGIWAKKNPRSNESAFWIDYNDRNIDDWIEAAKVTGIRNFSRYNCFGNWGHFDPDPEAFTNSWKSLKTCSEKAAACGIRTTTYTLSTFTRAFLLPDKFIAPALDPRFNTYVDSGTTLSRPLPGPEEGAKARPKFDYRWKKDVGLSGEIVSNTIYLVKTAKSVNLYGYMAPIECEKVKMQDGKNFLRKFVNVDGELICYRACATNDTELILAGCERGFYGSPIKRHDKGAPVIRLDSYDGYDSLLPGSDAMNDDIAMNIVNATKKGGMGNIILDGVERTDRSGNDLYSMNRFTKKICDNLPYESMTVTGSRLSHYTWHLNSNISWGEHDMGRGIRGSQFDWRLTCQLDLSRSDHPNKLGQYYPWACNLKDINWIMAFASAYDAGVDFQCGLPRNEADWEKFRRIRLWEDARLSGAFTEKEKMLMRQTDTEWDLKKENGKYKLEYVGRWIGNKFEEMPSADAPLKAIDAAVKITPCSIDRTWAHAPGQCERWCITDDACIDVSKNEAKFEVTSPMNNNKFGATIPLVVVRACDKEVVNPVVCFKTKRNEYYLKLKTTLKPGEYFTIPHKATIAFVYNSKHEMVRDVNLEKFAHNFMFAKGDKVTVSVSSDNEKPVPMKLNIRFKESSI